MTDLQKAVNAAVQQSAGKVSPPLAAFIARMLEYSASRSSSSSSVTAAAILARATAPPSSTAAAPLTVSDTTVRFQAAYEIATYEAHSTLENKRRARQRKLEEIVVAVEDAVAAATAVGESVDAVSKLGGVHRLVLDFCGAYCMLDAAASGAKPATAVGIMEYLSAVQKEMATALESVFPKVSLRQFSQVGGDERAVQLTDAARLVLGIRLYNWEAGKGGPGMEHTPSIALKQAKELLREMDTTASHALELAARYGDVIEAVASGALPSLSAAELNLCATRWPLEVNNRRQAATVAISLADELRNHVNTLEACLSRWNSELADLKRTVSSGGKVSKEAVYPRFRAIADTWLTAAEVRHAVAASGSIIAAIRTYLASASVSTLPGETIRNARLAVHAGKVKPLPFLSLLSSSATAIGSTTGAGEGEGKAELVSFSRGEDVTLALQGYCPVSLASSSPSPFVGILREGTPAVGVAKYQGKYYLCSSAAAMTAFLETPAVFLTCINTLALTYWELVNLLQLTSGENIKDDFPLASFPALVQFNGNIEAATTLQVVRQQQLLAQTQSQQTNTDIAQGEDTQTVEADVVATTTTHAPAEAAPIVAPSSSGEETASAAAGAGAGSENAAATDATTASSEAAATETTEAAPSTNADAATASEGEAPASAVIVAAAEEVVPVLPVPVAEVSSTTMSSSSKSSSSSSAAAAATSSSSSTTAINTVFASTIATTTGRINKKGAYVTDAAVETPVHFVERHIDRKYEFSEWALRRRAVAIANLRQCVTHSAQTDASAYRRDNDTQVYLPRGTGIQTGVSTGTNTDYVMQFIVGVRGAPEPFVEAAAANKAQGKPALASSTKVTRMEGPVTARVIQERLNG